MFLIPTLPRASADDEVFGSWNFYPSTISSTISFDTPFMTTDEASRNIFPPSGPPTLGAEDDVALDVPLQELYYQATQSVALSRAPALYKLAWDANKNELKSVDENIQRDVMEHLTEFTYDVRGMDELEFTLFELAHNIAITHEDSEQLRNEGVVVPIPPDHYDFDYETQVFLDNVATRYYEKLAEQWTQHNLLDDSVVPSDN